MTPLHGLQWPADRFFWAVLEAPGWKRAGAVPEGLETALEDELPVPLADLHAVCTSVPDGSLVACAAPRDELQAVAADALRLTPSEVPSSLGQTCDPAALNLLVGAFEPGVVRRARTRTHLVGAVTLAVVAILLSFGLTRRTNVWNDLATAADEAESQTLAAAFRPAQDPGAEIQRLRQAKDAISAQTRPIDASLILGSILEGWPANASAITHSVAVDQSGATLSVSLKADPASFLTSLRPPAGWLVDEPRLNATEHETRLTIRLRPGDRP